MWKVQVRPSSEVSQLSASAGVGRHVLHRVAGEVVVHQGPHLVGLALDPQEGVEGVHLVGEPHREGHRVRRGRLRGRAQHRGRQQHADGQGDGGAGPHHASTVPPVPEPAGPPTARRTPHDHVLHGVTRPDPYAWMSPVDGEHPAELLDHLAAERGWYDVSTAHLGSLASVLCSEMVARVPKEQRSGTWSRMRFSYYTRDARDRDYTVIWRESRHDSVTDGAKSSVEGHSGNDFVQVTAPPAGSGPEVVLDVNTLDAGTGYLDLGLSVVSPDEDLLAYALDTSGDEVFTLRFRDLRTGKDLPDVVTGVGYTGAWTSDSAGTFLYTVPDASWRHERIRAHRLGTRPDEDRDVLVEPDRRFEVTVRRCRSERAIVLLSESRDTSECWWVDPDGRRPGAAVPRRAAVRRELPRRARARCRWSGGPPARHRRRRRRVPAGLLPGARAGRPGPHGLARGAPRGARRAARARGRLRRSRRDHAAPGRRPDAARPPLGRPGRCRDRGDEPVPRRGDPAGPEHLVRRRRRSPSPTSPTRSRSCTRRSPWPTAR